MWSAIVSLCVCSATAQFNPFGYNPFSGQQGYDGYGAYGSPEFSQFQGVTTNGRDFNANSLSGYGVPPGVNYGDQSFAGQDFGQYGAQGYPGVGGGFPQGVGQNHLQQGGPIQGHNNQHESSVQHGAPPFNNGGHGRAPVIGQPGQSVLNPGHQQNVPLPNQIGANQADGQGHSQSHHASQQLAPQHEHQQQQQHHHHHHQQQQRQQHQHHHQEPQRLHQGPVGHGEAQIGSGHVPSPHIPHSGVPENQYEVNYNGVSQYPEQYQGQQLGLQVPQQYQQQTQQHHGEKSASSPPASSAPLESSGFKGIPLEAFAQPNHGQRLQQNPGEQVHRQSSGDHLGQRTHDQTEESTKKEVKKSS